MEICTQHILEGGYTRRGAKALIWNKTGAKEEEKEKDRLAAVC